MTTKTRESNDQTATATIDRVLRDAEHQREAARSSYLTLVREIAAGKTNRNSRRASWQRTGGRIQIADASEILIQRRHERRTGFPT